MAKKKRTPIVAVLNMKGGVGKTTISADVFRKLFSEYRIGTLLLDLDPQFNLTQALFNRKDYDKMREENKTIFSAMEEPSKVGLLEVAASLKPPPPPDKISKTLWHFKDGTTLSIVPGDFRLVKYSLMSEIKKLEAVRDRFLKFIELCRERFGLICIDCNPSSSFFTLCALHACTHLLVPVRPDRYSILGLEMLSEFVDAIPSIYPKPAISTLLNGIPRQNYDDSIENELRAHPVFGTSTFANVIHYSSILVARPDYTGFKTDRPVPHRKKLGDEIEAVAHELAKVLEIKK